MNPPRVYELTSPTNHKTRRITKIVQSICQTSKVSDIAPTGTFDAESGPQVVRVQHLSADWAAPASVRFNAVNYFHLRGASHQR